MAGEDWNIKVFKLVNRGYTSVWLDKLAPCVVRLGSAVYLTIALGLLLWQQFFAPESKLGIEGLGGVVLAITVAQGIKRIYPKPRPYMVIEGVRCPDPGLFIKKDSSGRVKPWNLFMKTLFRTSTTSNRSFPSGHIATAVSLVTVISWHFPIAAGFGLIYALVLGYARVYVGVHFPSDILAGILTGMSTGFFSAFLI